MSYRKCTVGPKDHPWVPQPQVADMPPTSRSYRPQEIFTLLAPLCHQMLSSEPTAHPTSGGTPRRPPLTFLRNSSATMRARALTDSFISLISLSISSMKWITKSTNLCLYICSVWKLVIRKLMSYPWGGKTAEKRKRRNRRELASRALSRPCPLWSLSYMLPTGHDLLPSLMTFRQHLPALVGCLRWVQVTDPGENFVSDRHLWKTTCDTQLHLG